MERKWHEKTWVVVVLLIIFWPIGLILLLKNPYYSKNARIAVGVLVVAIFACAAINSDSEPNSNDNQTQIAATTQQSPEERKKQEDAKRLQKEQEERERKEKEAAEQARKEQEEAERLQAEQEERERKKREAAEKRAQEERRKQEEAARKEQEKAQKELNEINSHSYAEIHIATLMNDLKANAARANKTYNGKYFKIVGGIVKNIESEGYYISLYTPTADFDINLHHIKCYPQTDLAKEQIFRLNMNQRVTVYGKITDVGEIMGYEFELLKIE